MKYDVEMRLPYIKPVNLTPKQQEIFDFHLEAMQPMPYVWITEDQELNGPSNILMYEPEIGDAFFRLNRQIIKASTSRNGWKAHEVAILVTVTAGRAHYGMYAHTNLAKKHGLTEDQIASIMAGIKPADLDEKESAAFDLATVLNQTGAIPGSVYDRTRKILGLEGQNAMIFAVGMFKMVGTLLNATNEPVPEYRNHEEE